MKPKILYIASNIPSPNHKSNDVILEMASKISDTYDVSIQYPSAKVPFGMNLFSKYRPFWNLKEWLWKDLKITPLKYWRLPIKGQASRLLHSLFNKLDLGSNPPVLIHAHFLLVDGLVAYLYWKKYNIPYIITARANDIRVLGDMNEGKHDFKMAKLAIKNATKVFCLNNIQQEVLERRFNTSCEIVPNGIDSDSLKFNWPASDKQDVIITSVGNFLKRKHFQWLIKAIQEYNGNIPLKTFLIGDGTEGEPLRKLAKGNKDIIFTGRLPKAEVFQYLRKGQIFSLPSINETFGLVFLEAAACGNAIIGRYRDGIWKSFHEKTEMIYVSTYDEYKTELYRLIEDEALRKKLATNAFERVEEFTWDKIITRLQTNYEEIIRA